MPKSTPSKPAIADESPPVATQPARKPLRIAVVAWGSLIPLPYPSGSAKCTCLRFQPTWKPDGPILPVEFCRVSSKKKKSNARLTLVLLPGARMVQTYWTDLDYADFDNSRALDDAIEALANREGTTGSQRLKKIGFWSRDGRKRGRIPDVVSAIDKWATDRRLDGVVWTDLKPNFSIDGDSRRVYEKYEDSLPHDVIAHFQRFEVDSKSGDTSFQEARNYVETTPRQITTQCREALERELHWNCLSEI